jgi:cobalt-zinc-cadmium efflux system protein
MNMKGAYLEVWSDMLGSLGVIVGAIVIRYTGWSWVDSAVAIAIGLWVLPRTWTLLRGSLNILLEGVPEGIAVTDIEQALRAMAGVKDVHDLHVWAISSGKISLTVHLVSEHPGAYPELLQAVRGMLARQFEIHHSTVQLEPVPCEQQSETHSFDAAPHA